MAESSYVKVYERLARSRPVRALLAAVPAELEAIHVVDVTFSLVLPEAFGQPAQAMPTFRVAMPGGSTVGTTNGGLWINVGACLAEDRIEEIVERLFGQKDGVPTYFCNKKVVLGHEFRKNTESFRDWLMSQHQGVFTTQLDAVKVRIAEEVRDWQASELVARKSREFLVTCAVKDIKRALSAYDHLGKDVLKAALDEYVCHSITED